MPFFIKSFFSGLPSLVYQFFFGFCIPSLWGELEFLVDVFFEFIIFFRPGSFRAALLGLNNLFLAFLFAGFICLIFYLFINKIIVFQFFYSAVLFIKDFQFNYVVFSLCFAVLPYNFIPLFNSLFICGFMLLYKLIFKVI